MQQWKLENNTNTQNRKSQGVAPMLHEYAERTNYCKWHEANQIDPKRAAYTSNKGNSYIQTY